ncbi:MAG TPA: aminoacyl-histidine dipeptidase [Anaeromyxobacteraceae bacterium]|nr:aminoacyl-histidine dipeptidase [Anaeromyxobacteraceae bacterium]
MLWRFFLELSRIPRGSKNEAAAARWVMEQARAAGCEVEQDGAGNVLARKRASPGREGAPVVALQSHVDMVCEKNEGTAHDFTRDPIDVYLDGDQVRARGTTLGADDGMGVAAALAVLASRDLAHGPIEALFTVDEETGLSGAQALAPGWLRARHLLNLDSEQDGELIIGCAGGIDTVATRRLVRAPPVPGRVALRLKVSGLKGGHSGTDIAAGRANALRLLGQVLVAVVPLHRLEVVEVQGGSKRNAIPREASAVVRVDPAARAGLEADVARLEAEWRAAFGQVDPGIAFAVEGAEDGAPISTDDAFGLVGLLAAAPHGVEAMSPALPGLVQTSTNLAIVETQGNRAQVAFLTRSALDASRRALVERIGAACALAGFTTELQGGYPGWRPEPGAGLVRLVDAVHAERFGRPMAIRALHAGLECGIIGEKYPGMEMVSFGPTLTDAHTPDERVSVPTVASFWTLLVAVLERLAAGRGE